MGLVAAAQDSTTGTTGLGLVEDAQQLTEGIRNQSWVDGGLSVLGTSLDGLSLAVDPLGTLGAWGVAWLIEHVRPLQDALDQLAGDPDEVAAHAATWANIATATDETRQRYADRLATDTADWHGASADAYRAHATENLSVLAGISVASGGISSAVEGAGLIVGLVRGLVRDLIAQFIATLAIRLPQWAAVEGISLGTATPLIASQVASLVATWANKIQRHIRALLASLRNLTNRINGLENILDLLRMRSDRLSRSNPTEPPPGSTPPPRPEGPPWHGRDDIAGPARGKSLTYPHSRHTLAGARHGQPKGENTVILPGYEEAVADDIRGIAAGRATWDSDTSLYQINGRTYGVKPTGTVFPGTGPGLVLLDRNEYAALVAIARAKGDVDSVPDFRHAPRFYENPEVIATAKAIYDGTYPP
ncbi:hypothetical protein [Actinoplanes sp. NBRC 101535]|uniref:WXG100 family type VII secretion target n=1 Tax=Actinoplanes sp. NBRC 101535 TaxID=3032196 RepID=UPI0024A34173|nr:hypothetical protein [Actinoplanes sp. NBRC 101535]GLY06932.1 hypothetical protein Acsp01_73110 [Actinoplanes sp. NBRC 101535]